MNNAPKFFPLGDAALTISFGNVISPEINATAIELAAKLGENPFPGFIEAVAAYSSVSVFFDVVTVKAAFPTFKTAFEAVQDLARKTFPIENQSIEHRIIEIPTSFGGTSALDLEFVAAESGLAKTAVIDIFTKRTYRVYMLGFLPGFAYMGDVDDRIAAPRKRSPRKRVPKGSVGIAGKQTGIYSLESPGGWQIIGRTKRELFTPGLENPTYLRAGDHVKFVIGESG